MMATRQSVDSMLQKCEDVMEFANDQFTMSSKQEHYNDVQYTEALQQLEDTYNEIAKLAHSANGQQREQLHRMRLQIQQMQNQMILLEH
jgi:hypothetical protein